MSTEENQTVAGEERPDSVEIHNVNQFAGFLVGWHANVVKRIEHLLTVPDGATFTVDPGTEEQPAPKEIVITGDALEAFKLGVNMALMGIKNLPFQVETEDVAAEEAAPESEAAAG